MEDDVTVETTVQIPENTWMEFRADPVFLLIPKKSPFLLASHLQRPKALFSDGDE